MIYMYADGDIPDEDLPIQFFYISSNDNHIIWNKNGELKPGKYFAVIGSEFSADIGVPRAYFTIPAIEQWWTVFFGDEAKTRHCNGIAWRTGTFDIG